MRNCVAMLRNDWGTYFADILVSALGRKQTLATGDRSERRHLRAAELGDVKGGTLLDGAPLPNCGAPNPCLHPNSEPRRNSVA